MPPNSNNKKAKSRRKMALASASQKQAAPPPGAPRSASASPPRDLAPGTAPAQDSPTSIVPDTPPTPDPPMIARDDASGESSPAPITAAPSAVEVSPPGVARTKPRGGPAATPERVDGSPAGPSVAFFDLDHTIIDTNSSWHWVQHEMNHGRIGVGMLATALYWFGRYALGFGAGAEKAGTAGGGTLRRDESDGSEGGGGRVLQPGDGAQAKTRVCGDDGAHVAAGERCLVCTTSWQHRARRRGRVGNRTRTSSVP